MSRSSESAMQFELITMLLIFQPFTTSYDSDATIYANMLSESAKSASHRLSHLESGRSRYLVFNDGLLSFQQSAGASDAARIRSTKIGERGTGAITRGGLHMAERKDQIADLIGRDHASRQKQQV